ncbi:MAG: pantetheine-phosphate adenylyltransferase [archaeon]
MEPKSVRAMYAFSGDPITYGHVDVVKRAAGMFSDLIVGIGVNPDKKYTFSLDERLEMAQRTLTGIPNVTVLAFKGLLIDYALEEGVDFVVRGFRSASDIEYEMNIIRANRSQWDNVDVCFLPANDSKVHISSSTTKNLQKEQGDVHNYVTSYVKQRLEERVSEQYVLGITGTMGAGKSYVGDKFVELGKSRGVNVHNVDLDKIGHQILGELMNPFYIETRKKIVDAFGPIVRRTDGFIDRKELGKIVFNDKDALHTLDEIMYEPMLLRTKREMHGKKGLILLNAALLAEANWSYLCNHNSVLVNCDKASQVRRLKSRGLSDEQLERRVASQYDFDKKKKTLQEAMARDNNGTIIEIDNSDGMDNIENAFEQVIQALGVKNVPAK